MNQVLEFLKSLVMPRKMAKYRYMSVLISIMIFLLSVYLINVPLANNISKNLPTQLEENYNLLIFQEMGNYLDDENKDNYEVLKELSSLECSVDQGEFICKNLEGPDFNQKITYTVDGTIKEINLRIKLTDEELTKDDVLFSTEEEPYIEDVEIYSLLFTKTFFFFQAHQTDIATVLPDNSEKVHAFDQYEYQLFMTDFNLTQDDQRIREFGNYLFDYIVQAHVSAQSSTIFTYTFLIVFLLPIIFVFIFWLFFKRTGKLKRYKEYYNIAAITSIIPILITFIVSWFWIRIFVNYMFIFSIYYLYVLYRINNSPEELEEF